MKNINKSIASILVAVAVAWSATSINSVGKVSASAATTTATATTSSSNPYGLANSIQDGAILQAFGWSFQNITDNMQAIAQAGYTAIQTMPVSAIYNGSGGNMAWGNSGDGHWWWVYQPTDYTIGNYVVGSESDLKTMCQTAKEYGVKIIVDVVANHTTSTTSAISSNMINAAGGSTEGTLFHSNGIDTSVNYNNRYSVIQNEMGGLPDLNTENTGLQNYLISYLKGLISDGVSGFRWDAAKHIGLPNENGGGNFWTRMLGTEVTGGASIFNYGEVLEDDSNAANDTDAIDKYPNYMDITASNYGSSIRSAVLNENFNTNTILNNGVRVSTSDAKLVKFVETHDNYLNDGTWSTLNDWDIKMAWAAITARKDSPTLFFDRPAGSSTSNEFGNNVLGAVGSSLYKDPTVAGVNKFRNAMEGQSEYLRNQGNQVLIVDRGTIGTCVINLGSTISLYSPTNLANGTYTDQINGGTFTVSNGYISGTVAGGTVAAIYKPSSSSTRVVTAGMASLKLPSGWSNPYCYMYYTDSSGTLHTNASWPGVAMTQSADSSIYYATLPSGWTSAYVLFSSGSNQIPGSGQTGFTLTSSEAMIYENGSWQTDAIT